MTQICLLEIEMKGAEKFIKAGLKAYVIFIQPPSIEELRERLTKRGTEKPEVIEKRMKIALEELEASKVNEFITASLVNDDFEVFYQNTVQVLKKQYSHFLY